MESKFEFDDTRNSLGINDLSDLERKEMKDKMMSAGGKVLSEKEIKKIQEKNNPSSTKSSGQDSSSSSRSKRKNTEIKLPSQIAREKKRAEQDARDKKAADLEKARKKLSSPITKLFIKFRTMMAGITPFSAREVKHSFISFIMLDLKQALVEINLIGNDLFLSNKTRSKKIIQSLDSKNIIFMEVIEAAYVLFKSDSFKELVDKLESLPNHANAPMDLIEKPVKEFFKKIYYIYPYQDSLKKGLQLASETFIKETENETEINLFETKKKKINKNIKIIFQITFHKLFQLICRIDETDYPPFSGILERILEIKLDDKLGKRKTGETNSIISDEDLAEDDNDESEEDENSESNEESSDENESKEDDEEKKEKKPLDPAQETKEYKWGISLMRGTKLPDYIEKFKSQYNFIPLKLNDKVLLAFLFFLEFDHEYSFVLTTNKIKINIDYSSGIKIDYKSQMADIYNESRTIIRAFETYIDTVKEFEKLKEGPKSTNYVDSQKTLSKNEQHVDTEARNTRALIKTYMEKVATMLGKLISDMKGEKKIINNMDDIVEFSKGLEGSKRLNGKAVQNCILESYCYAIALKFRVGSGDLYGGIKDMTDEEMIESFGAKY